MENQEMIYLDQGFFFGMGIFETIDVKQNYPLFLPWHLERMEKGLGVLGINKEKILTKVTGQQVMKYLQKNPMNHGVLKIMVSEKNVIFTTRENPYIKRDYKQGFRLRISSVLRNETSVFTYVKSFQYGDNLLEKANCKKAGYQEALLLNTKGQVTETTASNIFLVKKGKIYTPKIECGLLDGIVRRYVIENFDVEEIIISRENLMEYEEAFLTNSLMGIMPVASIQDKIFQERKVADKLMQAYENEVNRQIERDIMNK